MKKIFLIILGIVGMISCSNSDSEREELNGILTGNFIEITPENERTNLIFSSNSNQLQERRITDGDPSSRTFSIRLLDDNMIELSSNESDVLFPRIFHYQIIDDNKFEIGNINQNDPTNTIMMFERN